MAARTRTRKRPPASGLTIVEVLICLGIVSVIFVGAAGFQLLILSHYRQTTAMSHKMQETLVVNDYLWSNILSAGGGTVAPWIGLSIEDNTCDGRGPLPSCNGSDRLTILRSVDELPDCKVSAQVSYSTTDYSGQVRLGDTVFGCCAHEDMEEKQIVIRKGDNVIHGYVPDNGVDATSEQACTVSFVAGQASFANNPGPVTDWSQSSAHIVSASTVYLDTATQTLYKFEDKDNNQQVDPLERTPLAGDVRDVQFAFGFDLLPVDGIVTDQKSATDEWLYNAPGVVETRSDAFFITAPNDRLTMIGIGVITGEEVRVGRAPASAGATRIFNGAEILPDSGITYFPVVTKHRLRN